MHAALASASAEYAARFRSLPVPTDPHGGHGGGDGGTEGGAPAVVRGCGATSVRKPPATVPKTLVFLSDVRADRKPKLAPTDYEPAAPGYFAPGGSHVVGHGGGEEASAGGGGDEGGRFNFSFSTNKRDLEAFSRDIRDDKVFDRERERARERGSIIAHGRGHSRRDER